MDVGTRAALDYGVNVIATAPMYGFGLSENIVGKAIRDRRDRVVLATRCGLVCDPIRGRFKGRSNAAAVDPNGHITIHGLLSPDSIRAELQARLRRLQTDDIDLKRIAISRRPMPSNSEALGVYCSCIALRPG